MKQAAYVGIVISLLLVSAVSHAQDASSPSDKIPYSSLTPEERDIINRGEIGTPAYITGGVIGTVFGLGIGQAIQGRYLPTGLIITIGEAGSLALLEYGLSQCIVQAINDIGTNQTSNCSGTAIGFGVAGLVGFKIWEIVDLWATPPSINERYRNLQRHVEGGPHLTFIPAIAPDQGSLDGAGLALQMRF